MDPFAAETGVGVFPEQLDGLLGPGDGSGRLVHVVPVEPAQGGQDGPGYIRCGDWCAWFGTVLQGAVGKWAVASSLGVGVHGCSRLSGGHVHARATPTYVRPLTTSKACDRAGDHRSNIDPSGPFRLVSDVGASPFDAP